MESVNCFGGADGEIQVTATGGRLPYEYSIDGGLTWQLGSNFPNLSADTFEVITRDDFGCADTVSIEVIQPDSFIVTLTPELDTVEFFEEVQLIVTTNHPATYTWSADTTLSCLYCATPIATPGSTRIYEVMVTDTNGCEVTLISRIVVDYPRRAYVANLFTPNADGANDLFLVQGGAGVVAVRNFRVFDRWGELVFEAQNVQPNDPAGGWNGRFKGQDMNPGVFAWFAEIVYEDGFVELLKGDVTLIR
jgi:gliding motility-associated-like protein